MWPSFRNPGLRNFGLLNSGLLVSAACVLLAGCGSSSTPTGVNDPPPVTTYSGAAFSGTVKAGTQPLTGATVLLYAVGVTGNGSAATSLLSGALTTDANGIFTVPAGYTCTTGATQVYVVARGGSVGTAAANSAIVLLATLGACNQVTASEHVVVNEVTTVANAWALAQFLSAGANIGASATNTVGLANAVATAASLASPLTGVAPGTTFPANGASPAPRLNSLANLLNTCASAASTSSACSTLLGASQNTLDAALQIVRNPGSNVAALYTQSTASSAYSPALAAAPSDWTLFVTYTGGGMSFPTGIGVDSNGNIWVASLFVAGSTDTSVGSVTEFSPVGTPLFPSGITGYGLNNIYGLAIDAQNNIWIPNQYSDQSINNGQGSVTELNSSGQPISGATGYTVGGLIIPIAIAIDTDGSAWVADNWKGRVTKLSSTGQSLSGTTGFVASSFAYPVAIAVDANHNAWVGDSVDSTITEISQNGSTITPFDCCDEPAGLAIDQSGNIWAANYAGRYITELSNNGTVLSGSGFAANAGLIAPQGIVIDGNGNLWVTGVYNGFLVELAGAKSANPGHVLSPAAGWAPEAALNGAFAAAVDASGNLWVSNFDGNSITEYVGIAGPVKTPLIGPPQAP